MTTTNFIPWGDSFLREINVNTNTHTKNVAKGMLAMYRASYNTKHFSKDNIRLNPINGYETLLWVATGGRVYLIVARDPNSSLNEANLTLYQTYLSFDPTVAGDMYRGITSLNSKKECIFYINCLISTPTLIDAYRLPIAKQYEYIYKVLKNHYEYDKQINPFHIRPAPMFSNTIAHCAYIKKHYG